MEIRDFLDKEINRLFKITDKVIKNRFDSAKLEDEVTNGFYHEYLIVKGRIEAAIYILKQQKE